MNNFVTPKETPKISGGVIDVLTQKHAVAEMLLSYENISNKHLKSLSKLKLFEDMINLTSSTMSAGSVYLTPTANPNKVRLILNVINDADMILIPYRVVVNSYTDMLTSLEPIVKNGRVSVTLEKVNHLPQYISLYFAAISTDDSIRDPAEYIRLPINTIYDRELLHDIPDIRIKLENKGGRLKFLDLRVNDDGEDIIDLTQELGDEEGDKFGIQYGNFSGYKSSKAPSFGVCFSNVRCSASNGQSVETNLVFTPNYKRANPPAIIPSPEKFIIPPDVGIGNAFARATAIDLWVKTKSTSQDSLQRLGPGTIATIISAGMILASGAYNAYSALHGISKTNKEPTLYIKILNFLEMNLCVVNISNFKKDDIFNMNTPIIKSGETMVFPLSTDNPVSSNFWVDIAVHYAKNIQPQGQPRIFRLSILNAGINEGKFLRVHSIKEVFNGDRDIAKWDLAFETQMQNDIQFARISYSKRPEYINRYFTIMTGNTKSNNNNILDISFI